MHGSLAWNHAGGSSALAPPGVPAIVSKWREGSLAAVGIMAPAGYRAEQPGEEGLAPLSQQMLFQGTRRRGALDIAREIDRLGGTVTGRTSAQGALLVALVDRSQWSEAMALLVEMATEPRFDEGALELEKRARRAELEFARQASAKRARMLLESAIWQGSASSPAMADFQPDAVRGFFERNYRPEVCVAGAVGPVEEGSLTQQLRAAGFGAAQVRRPSEPERAWHTVTIHETAAIGRSHLCLALPCPAANRGLALLNEVLGGGPGSRLISRVGNQGIVRQIRSSFTGRGRGTAWIFEATVAPGWEAEALDSILSELRAVAGPDPVRHEEVWAARESLASRARQSAANPLALLESALEDALGGSEPGNFDFDQSGVDEVSRAAAVFIAPWLAQLSVASIGPARNETPAAKLHSVVDAYRHGPGQPSINGSH